MWDSISVHNWTLQHFRRDYVPSFSHHSCCVRANFIHERKALLFNGESERQIFEKLMAGYLLPDLLPEICWEEIAEFFFFYISFWYLTWDTNPLRLISQNTTYQTTATFIFVPSFRKQSHKEIFFFLFLLKREAKIWNYFFGDFLSEDFWQKLWE